MGLKNCQGHRTDSSVPKYTYECPRNILMKSQECQVCGVSLKWVLQRSEVICPKRHSWLFSTKCTADWIVAKKTETLREGMKLSDSEMEEFVNEVKNEMDILVVYCSRGSQTSQKSEDDTMSLLHLSCCMRQNIHHPPVRTCATVTCLRDPHWLLHIFFERTCQSPSPYVSITINQE